MSGATLPDPMWAVLPWRPGGGPILAQAADASTEARRLLVRAALLAETAGVDVTSDDFGDLLEDASSFATHMLNLADGYAHAQVACLWVEGERAFG